MRKPCCGTNGLFRLGLHSVYTNCKLLQRCRRMSYQSGDGGHQLLLHNLVYLLHNLVYPLLQLSRLWVSVVNQNLMHIVGLTTPLIVFFLVFMDGTWLYYSMVQGRSERNCPIERKFGTKWSKTHRVDWNKLPQIIASNLREQLGNQKILTPPGVIDITRTSVFTSLRADTEQGSARDTMLGNFYKQNFDVHR